MQSDLRRRIFTNININQMKKGRCYQKVLTKDFRRGQITGVMSDGLNCRVVFGGMNPTEWILAEDLYPLSRVEKSGPDLLEALIQVRRHGLIEKDGYEPTVLLVGTAISKATE